MKKVLNVFGILGATFFSIVLTTLLICFVFLINIKSVVSERGIVSALKSVNVVETIKNVDDGVMWEDFKQLSNEMNLTEEQFESILNSNAIKEEFGEIVSNLVNSITSDTPYTINKDDFVSMIDLAIEEYNKVADEKITKEIRDETVKVINDEFINNINESLSEINIEDSIDEENISILKTINYILFGEFATVFFFIILFVIILIVLCRFSPIKWMPYVGVSFLITGLITLVAGLFVSFIPLDSIKGIGLLIPIKNVLSTNIYISTLILFIIFIVLAIIHKCLKKQDIADPIMTTEQIEN